MAMSEADKKRLDKLEQQKRTAEKKVDIKKALVRNFKQTMKANKAKIKTKK